MYYFPINLFIPSQYIHDMYNEVDTIYLLLESPQSEVK